MTDLLWVVCSEHCVGLAMTLRACGYVSSTSWRPGVSPWSLMAAVAHTDRNMSAVLGPPFLHKITLTIHLNKACRPDMRRAGTCGFVGVPVVILFRFLLVSASVMGKESDRFITFGNGHVCRRPGATRPPLSMAENRWCLLVGEQNW